MQKTFIGPHLRRLRVERGETQGAMAKVLGISPSYVNLLENNERSVSVQVLLRLFDAYGVDWRDIAEEDGTAQLSDLRAVIQDPLFSQTRPDLPQLRAALVHAPALVHSFMALYRSYAVVSDQLLSLTESGAPQVSASPEAAVHDIFRRNRNHFREVEEAAATLGANRFQTIFRVILPGLMPAILTGFALAPVALVRAVGQVEILFTLLFSKFFLKEKMKRTDVIGALAVVAGVVLVLIGR
jgi:transcriptional regulator with XRE-family HTH domain/drug/metabolite transporter superfamily protein YnfA